MRTTYLECPLLALCRRHDCCDPALYRKRTPMYYCLTPEQILPVFTEAHLQTCPLPPISHLSPHLALMSMHPSNCDYFPYTTPGTPGLDEKHLQAPVDLSESTSNTSRPHASGSWRETRVLTLSILLIIVGVVGNALFVATGYHLVGALFGYGVLAPIFEPRVAYPTMALNSHQDWCSLVMHALVMGLFSCTILLGALSGCMWITTDVWLGLKQLEEEARDIQADEVFADEKRLMLV